MSPAYPDIPTTEVQSPRKIPIFINVPSDSEGSGWGSAATAESGRKEESN